MNPAKDNDTIGKNCSNVLAELNRIKVSVEFLPSEESLSVVLWGLDKIMLYDNKYGIIISKLTFMDLFSQLEDGCGKEKLYDVAIKMSEKNECLIRFLN
ncbi:MAG: hypothetical protein LLG05_17845 [Porphyromonadaceae bacterium]|nr:hypothetical protein [Porphyromonadaceae bacterium]